MTWSSKTVRCDTSASVPAKKLNRASISASSSASIDLLGQQTRPEALSGRPLVCLGDSVLYSNLIALPPEGVWGCDGRVVMALAGIGTGMAETVMLTCDMDAFGPFRVKIEAFEGAKEAVAAGFSAEQSDTLLANLFVEAQLMEGGAPMGLPSRTGYAPYETHCRWNDTLTFPHIRYWHLPRDAELRLQLRSLCAPRQYVTLGEASFRLFSKKGRLKSGRKKAGLTIAHHSREGEDVAQLHTPPPPTPVGAAHGGNSMERLEKLIQR